MWEITEVVVERLEMILVEIIKRIRGEDEKVVKVVEEMKRARVRILKGDEQEIEKDLRFKEEKVYMLKDKELRLEVIWLHYDILVVRHRGR